MKPIKAKWMKQFITDRIEDKIPCIVYGFATCCDRPVAIVKFKDSRTLDYVDVNYIEIEDEED